MKFLGVPPSPFPSSFLRLQSTVSVRLVRTLASSSPPPPHTPSQTTLPAHVTHSHPTRCVYAATRSIRGYCFARRTRVMLPAAGRRRYGLSGLSRLLEQVRCATPTFSPPPPLYCITARGQRSSVGCMPASEEDCDAVGEDTSNQPSTPSSSPCSLFSFESPPPQAPAPLPRPPPLPPPAKRPRRCDDDDGLEPASNPQRLSACRRIHAAAVSHTDARGRGPPTCLAEAARVAEAALHRRYGTAAAAGYRAQLRRLCANLADAGNGALREAFLSGSAARCATLSAAELRSPAKAAVHGRVRSEAWADAHARVRTSEAVQNGGLRYRCCRCFQLVDRTHGREPCSMC